MRGATLRLAAPVLAALALAAPTGAALAQDAAAAASTTNIQSPILTLDRERLFSETLFGKAVDARFKSDSDTLLAENLRLEKALEAEERDLTDRRATLPATEFQLLASAFDTKAEQIRAAQLAKSRAIADTREAEQKRFLEAAIPVLGELMRDSGAAAIFDKNMIILSLRGIDITDDAIARIDAVLGTGGATPTGQGTPEPAKPEPVQTEPTPPAEQNPQP